MIRRFNVLAFGVILLGCLHAVAFPVTQLQAADRLSTDSSPIKPGVWETVEAKGVPTARHEAAFVDFEDRCYLMGGRRINPVDVFDPATNSWSSKARTPLELHHFQAVVVDDAIYLMGAMTGPYPKEVPLEKIVVYYPEEDRFDFVHSIPESRRRGGAGAVYHDGKIYLVGGITNGHVDGYRAWLDSYDPRTGAWEILPDAPHARDHFQAVVSDGKLYTLGGRQTSQATGEVFSRTIAEVDVFDFKSQTWFPPAASPALPTPRAGNMAAAWRGSLIVGGGESTQKTAHNQVEVFQPGTHPANHPGTYPANPAPGSSGTHPADSAGTHPASLSPGTWQIWPSLERGRHGSGFAIIDGYLYTASGSGNRGGAPELHSIERLLLPD